MLNIRRLPILIYKYRYVCVSIIFAFGTILYLLLRLGLVCTNLETWHHVKRICRSYETGLAIGSLCRPLCTTNDINSLNCHSFRQGKEAVFSAVWHKTKMIFKSTQNSKHIHWYDNGVKKYPTEQEFHSIIRGVVYTKLNRTISHDNIVGLTRLKPTYIELDPIKRGKEMDNLWPLLQDNEYLLTSLYTDRDVFPQLLGTCGSYFAVEYLHPLQFLSKSNYNSNSDWIQQLRTSIQIIELINELDKSFPEPFHLCDLKPEHFGWTKAASRLKFIDLDSVYPRSIINAIISTINDCKTDFDCDFYDCRGRCDRTKRKCINSVANNNMQIICEKLFLGWRMRNKLFVPGLLMTQHTPSNLAAVLRECANPKGEVDLPRASAPDELRNRLYNILVEIEQSISNNELFR